MGIAGITFGGYLVAVNPSEWFSWTSGLPVGVAGAVRASGGIVTSIGLIVITLALNEKYKTWLAIAARRVGYAIVLVILIYSLSESVATFASDDAFTSVTESPTALLEVDPVYSPTNLINIASAKNGVLLPVNIVHITKNFTFAINHLEAECAKKRFVSLNQAREPRTVINEEARRARWQYPQSQMNLFVGYSTSITLFLRLSTAKGTLTRPSSDRNHGCQRVGAENVTRIPPQKNSGVHISLP